MTRLKFFQNSYFYYKRYYFQPIYFLCSVQYLCSILQSSIETISFTTPSETFKHPPSVTYPETKYLLYICQIVSKQLQTLPNEIGSTKSITNNHMDVLLKQVEIVVKSSLCVPRFFFQVLQNTSVKLALTPQPRISGEPIFVQPNSNLVVKVEGKIYVKCWEFFLNIRCRSRVIYLSFYRT